MKAKGAKILKVNLGPVAEFSSKVAHLVNGHHDAGQLASAVASKLREDADAKPIPYPDPVTVRDLHYWVWCPDVSEGVIPSNHTCDEKTPKLSNASRPSAWLLTAASLVATARSHGSYSRKEEVANCRISFVLKDCVITMGPSLVQWHVGQRGWGALTEHHLLVAFRDAIENDPVCRHVTFDEAVAHYIGEGRRSPQDVLLLSSDQQRAGLPVYTASGDGPAMRVNASGCIHLMLCKSPSFALAVEGALNSTCSSSGQEHKVRIMQCSPPPGVDIDHTPRAITICQGHNNCGRLWPALCSVATAAGGAKKHSKRSDLKSDKKSKKEKKSKKRIEKGEDVPKRKRLTESDEEDASEKQSKGQKNKEKKRRRKEKLAEKAANIKVYSVTDNFKQGEDANEEVASSGAAKRKAKKAKKAKESQAKADAGMSDGTQAKTAQVGAADSMAKELEFLREKLAKLEKAHKMAAQDTATPSESTAKKKAKGSKKEKAKEESSKSKAKKKKKGSKKDAAAKMPPVTDSGAAKDETWLGPRVGDSSGASSAPTRPKFGMNKKPDKAARRMMEMWGGR